MKLNIEKFLKEMMHTKRLVIILLIGVALLLLPSLLPREKAQTGADDSAAVFYDRSEYEKELEKRLSSILSTVRGVSRVSVMITLEDTGEIHYARNTTESKTQTQDGAFDESTNQAEESTALRGEAAGKQSPIHLKTAAPSIAGVLVTAKGVESSAAQSEIAGAVRAVLNVPPHRIQILCKP